MADASASMIAIKEKKGILLPVIHFLLQEENEKG
jgi:hypothetical protein